MTKADIEAKAGEAVKDAAESETIKNKEVAAAAGAVTEKKTTEAAITAVAAAESAAALAKTEAAEAMQNAGTKVAETKGDVEWLKSHADKVDGSFQSLSKEQGEIKEAVLALAQNQSQFQERVSRLLTPPAPPQEPGLEKQIVNPVEDPPKAGGAATGGTKGAAAPAKKSPRSRVWTTGRRA